MLPDRILAVTVAFDASQTYHPSPARGGWSSRFRVTSSPPSSLKKALSSADADLQGPDPVGLVVDALQMSGYDAAAREQFVLWHHARRSRISRVAVLTRRSLWHMVIRAMSFAANVPMQPFQDLDVATAWARGPALISLWRSPRRAPGSSSRVRRGSRRRQRRAPR